MKKAESYPVIDLPGLEPALYQRLYGCLERCGPFASTSEIEALFVDQRIHYWYSGLPQANNRAARIKTLVGYLYHQYSNAQENGLVLFLQVLSDHVGVQSACHQELVTLAQELELHIERSGTPEHVQGSNETVSNAAPETPRARLLIVEDDMEWQEIYLRALRNTNHEITTARTVNNALEKLNTRSFDVVITDLKMLGRSGEFSGFGVLDQAKALNPFVQVIVITGYGNTDRAMRSMGSGAYDYITKDLDLRKKLPLTVQGALEAKLKRELLEDTDRIIGNSPSMQDLFEQIATAAESDVNVLILGEPGTGKHLVAQTIHRRSRRRKAPFIVVDCGRLSETALESELFGYERGTLYGDKAQAGKFEDAQGGTVFLDGVGDLDIRLQTRLVRVITDRLVERIGSRTPIELDVRIIASTDKDLPAMLRVQRFEQRLFFALNEFEIEVPPLRQRKDGDDIPALAAMFLRRVSEDRRVEFTSEAVELLRRYDYPGNVRELESAVKYAFTKASGDKLSAEHLRPEIRDYQRLKLQEAQKREEGKDPRTIMRVCPLNLGACSKTDEILRLYSSHRVFVNVPDIPAYAEYEQAIRHILESCGLVPVLSKDHFEPTALLCNICKLVQTCKYGIADISQPAASVLYELGLMHANGVHCTILKEHGADLAADIQGLYFLEYGDVDSLEERLLRWIEDQVREAVVPAQEG